MLLQKILFPRKDLCTISEMYYRLTKEKELQINSSGCHLQKDSVLSFDTYFNSFSVGMWQKYTKITNIHLSLESTSPIEVKFYKALGYKDEKLFKEKYKETPDNIIEYSKDISKSLSYSTSLIDCIQKKDGNKITFEFEKLDFSEGEIIFPVIKAKEDTNLSFIGWETNIEEKEIFPVKLAVGICTYKREEFIKRNVYMLKEKLLENKESSLYGNLEVYIADNGQTLNENLFQDEKIHIFPNKNLGGTAGFTRTIIESFINDKNKGFTHIVLMDDDILLPESTLERMHALLKLLKDEYKDSLVGGAMFSLSEQQVQTEYGAEFIGSKLTKLNNKYYDMTDFSAVCANYIPAKINYTGWWCCCCSKKVLENGLPMPYFIHFDDIEYGIRNCKNGIILINGISVWHPTLSGKGPVFYNYYDDRNHLITECVTGIEETPYVKSYSFDQYFDFIFKQPLAFQLKLKAIKDFLKGPDYIINQDAELLQKQISSKKYEYKELAALKNRKIIYAQKPFKKRRIERALQILSLCLPSINRTLVVSKETMRLPLMNRYLFILDKDGKTGILCDCRKNVRTNLIKFLWYRHQIKCRFPKLKAEWQEGKKMATSLEFWKKYLEI